MSAQSRPQVRKLSAWLPAALLGVSLASAHNSVSEGIDSCGCKESYLQTVGIGGWHPEPAAGYVLHFSSTRAKDRDI